MKDKSYIWIPFAKPVTMNNYDGVFPYALAWRYAEKDDGEYMIEFLMESGVVLNNDEVFIQ
jgi:hypothetical protein